MKVVYSDKIPEGLKVKDGNHLIIGVKRCANCKDRKGFCCHQAAG